MDWKTFLMTTYTIVLPIILGYIVWLLQSSKKREYEKIAKDREEQEIQERKTKAANRGIMLILRYMLSRYHTEYIYQSYVTSEQLSDFEEIYAAYESLGGNSVAVRWREEVLRLPVKDNAGSNLTPTAQMYLREKYEKKS